MAGHLITRAEHVARSRALMAQSSERMDVTLKSIQRSKRRSLSVVRGGALADEPSDLNYVRDRVRRFFPPPTWKAPEIYAGPSMGQRHCAICGREIFRGMSEYELQFEDVATLTLDRVCFALWQSEGARN